MASWRLRSWVRKRWAWITMTPSLVMRWPAVRASRIAASSGKVSLRVSKRNWAEVAAFCPPGLERDKADLDVVFVDSKIADIRSLMAPAIDSGAQDCGFE
ncbi:hypothetical protein ABIF63_008920 [Bradyrhizobium japonicum]|uniref:Uncharacterized protein n=1 Tax=Bradyrhizobium japonicum TaxID=375 RepID=A0ABV2S6K1_BRAJP